MVNIPKQIDYWRMLAGEDWPVGVKLVREGHIRQGLFFVHLALEKALKAHVCRAIQDIAPRTHDLVGLARRAELDLSQEQLHLLNEVTSFNLQGRYPERLLPAPPRAEAARAVKEAEEIFQWLMRQL